MSMNLAIYLLRDGTTPDTSVLSDKIGAEYEEVTVREDVEFDAARVCYVRKTEPKTTAWTSWLEPVFDFGDALPQNQSSGCVVIVEAKGRLFAIAFGTGRHALDPACIQYGFGLRVALNKVHPEKLRQLVSKTVDIRTREKSTYHHAGGSVSEFAMDLDAEWLRTVAGSTASKEDFTAVAGTDAIRLQNYKKPLEEIRGLCENLLEAYEQEVPEAFSFAENVRPIATKDPLHDTLETEFIGTLDSGRREGLEVIVDWAVADKMDKARVFFGHEERPVSELSGDEIWKAVDQLLATAADLVPSKIKLDILDGAGEKVVPVASLTNVIQAELEHDGKTYLRLERRWFEVADSYVKRIDERVRDLPELTTELGLPVWNQAIHADEVDYNTDVSSKKGWLLQDKKLVYAAGKGHAGYEPCDLLTEDARWIHVKEGNSSACINHLCGQISAAAELYARHDRSRAEMHRRYKRKWPKVTPQLGDRRSTFVAAIGRKDVKKDLLGRMLVAKINLLDHARRVRALDYDFYVAGFEVIPDPAKKRKTKRKAKARPQGKTTPKSKATPNAIPKPKPKTKTKATQRPKSTRRASPSPKPTPKRNG